MDMIISGENLSINIIWKIIENYKKIDKSLCKKHAKWYYKF